MLRYNDYNRKGPQRCFCGLFMAKTPYGWVCDREVRVERGWLWEHL